MKEFQGLCCDTNGCRLPPPPLRVQLFSDYMCAWCYLADGILAGLKRQYYFELEHIGFELHEGTSENGENMSLHHPDTPQVLAYISQIGSAYGVHVCDLPIFANTK